jgi:uncharacterized protein YdhG (YjbR/CyaY superfamily)
MTKHRIYNTSVASVYVHYVAKAERKGRTKVEVDEIIRWLTGYRQEELEAHLKKGTDFETFFQDASELNPLRILIKGTICGIRIESIEEPLMKEIRYMDKLIDELAQGKSMDRILRKQEKNDDFSQLRLATPARRALLQAGIETLEQLSQYTEEEVLKLHGMGKSATPKLKTALEQTGKSFKKIDLIHEYIMQFPDDVRAQLSLMRKLILQIAPEAIESISYKMPTYKLNRKVVYFAGYENHIGFYPTPSVITAFQEQLTSYKTSKGAVQFPLHQPLPKQLIEDIVEFQLIGVS